MGWVVSSEPVSSRAEGRLNRCDRPTACPKLVLEPHLHPMAFPCGQGDLRNGSCLAQSHSFKDKEHSLRFGVLMDTGIETDRESKVGGLSPFQIL